MPIYEYKGLSKAGKNVRGTLDAENVRAARTKLKKDGIYVVDLRDKTKAAIKKNKKPGGGKSVGVEDLSSTTRQLAVLLKANIPLVESLAATADQVENPTLKEAISDIKNMVNEGSSFYKGLSKYPKIFDTTFVSMCEAGETSGTLDVILVRLAEFTEAQNELNSKVKSAMLYPVIMFLFTMGMLSVLFIFVIPKMQTIFESAEMELPWYTNAVIGFSSILVNYWWLVLAGGIGSAIVFRTWKSSPAGSKQYDAILLKLPVVGRLARMVAVSRFTRTLSTLLQGGVPMLGAMDIVKNVVGNDVLARAIIQARDNISEGESIAGPLKKSEQFPPIVIHMISIGEKTGELENMLTQVSDSYDFQVKTQISGLTALLEPVMIIMMGIAIGVIVFSIMLPMFDMANMAG
ncbi:MAG: type II secretion system inner membrane protein GspF [Bdellovibrionaceae bacterium]|nr:type II secretion system inner membrane protein GspF [Pseudobdellovibrionaceae bacterium]